MNFSEQIKKIRSKENITQEEMAKKLGISRQAVSNWENDRNLPDIELLISISKTFGMTLDELILGDTDMNNMTKKLIKDGSENKRIAMNLMILKIGFSLLGLGVVFFLAALFGQPSWENFLSDVSFISIVCGLLTFMVLGLKNMVNMLFRKEG